MYIVKKRLQRAKQQLKRENELCFPDPKQNEEAHRHNAFASTLQANRTQVKQNEEKFRDSLRDTIKSFIPFDYFCILVIATLTAGFTYSLSSLEIPKTKLVKQHQDIAIAVFTLLGLLAGFGIGSTTQVSLRRTNKESESENLYNRLSVRLFDLMHEKYPDLNEKVLKACNPELSHVIMELIITNIPESDVREIRSIAAKVSKYLQKAENWEIIECDRELKNALSIIEQNLITNSLLRDAILSVYRGNAPASFILQNQQKTL